MTDVATTALPNDKAPTIVSTIQSLRPEIQRALATTNPAEVDRIARIAITAVRKDRKLAFCSAASFSAALLTATALGLEPGTDQAYLIPYGNECTLVVGYQGITKLFYQHPLAADLAAEFVCANDEFDYQKGTDPYLRHKPARGDRGEVIAYYAVARLTTGATKFEVLTPEECKELRGKVGPDPRFKGGDPQHWMERKTALKQLAKLLPKSPAFDRALRADERPGSELRAELQQVQAIAGPPADEHVEDQGGPA